MDLVLADFLCSSPFLFGLIYFFLSICPEEKCGKLFHQWVYNVYRMGKINRHKSVEEKKMQSKQMKRQKSNFLDYFYVFAWLLYASIFSFFGSKSCSWLFFIYLFFCYSECPFGLYISLWFFHQLWLERKKYFFDDIFLKKICFFSISFGSDQKKRNQFFRLKANE